MAKDNLPLRNLIKAISLAVAIGSFIALIEMPVNLSDWTIGANPSSIQSLSAVPYFPFLILYSVFVGSIIVAGFAFRSKNARVFLLCLASTIIVSFWFLQSPWGIYEGPAKLVNTILLQTSNMHQALPYSNYLGYPSLFLLGAMFSNVTSFGGPLSAIPIMMISLFVLVVLGFLVANRLLKNGFYAFLAVLLFMEGTVQLSEFSYHPDYYAIFFLPLFAVIFLLEGSFKREILATILGLAIIITDFSASFVVLAFLTVYYLYQRIIHSPDASAALKQVWIFAGIFLFWSIFWAVGTTNTLLNLFQQHFATGLSHVETVYASNTTGPLWATWARLGWIGLLIGIPALVVVFGIFVKRLRPPAMIALLIIAPILVGIMSVIGQGGINFFITLIYAPFGGALLLCYFLRRRKLATICLVVLALVLLTPSFFSSSSEIVDYTSPHQYYQSAEYFVTHSTSSSTIIANDYAIQYYATQYHSPFVNVLYPPDISVQSSAQIISDYQYYIQQFSGYPGTYCLITGGWSNGYYHILGVAGGSLVQNYTQQELNNGDTIYADGYATLYVS